MATKVKADQIPIDGTGISIETYRYVLSIANGADTSDAFSLNGETIVGLIINASTFEISSLTIEVSLNASTWYTLSTISISTAANRAINVFNDNISGWPYARFKGNTTVGANREVIVIIKRI